LAGYFGLPGIQEKRARANMDFYNNEKISRRKFVKEAAGAAVCCACYSSDCLAASKENSEQDGKGKEHLAAACGTYCGACPAYIAKHSEDMQMKMKLQRLCAANKQNDSRCSDCQELPCYRITNLINMGAYLHRKEYLPNLKNIREMGVQEWVKKEEERWRCPQCGLPISYMRICSVKHLWC
jgi:hypothetical protein